MNKLHAILVKLDNPSFNSEESRLYALEKAKEEIEYYQGSPYGWRANHNRQWVDIYSDNVILGSNDKDKLIKELNKFKDRPLKEAIMCLPHVDNTELGWRTREEIDKDPNISIAPSEHISECGKYFSGIRHAKKLIDEDTIRELWNEDQMSMRTWALGKIFSLIEGNYTFDSQFYSAPDLSSKITKSTYKDVCENTEDYALVIFDLHI